MSTTTIPLDSLTDALRHCRKQQQAWARVPVGQRLRPVRELRHLLVQEANALCEAVASDLNKPAEEVLAGELLPLAAACRFLERQAAGVLKPRRVPTSQRPVWLWGQSDRVHRRPRGVVAIIGTWNYPLMLNGVQIVQALTAGNGVVWKPSEVAPASAAALARVLRQAGWPDDLLQILPATREGGAVVANADIDHVVFTGASTTGRRLAENLGRRLISSTLELSGCDALFVMGDADVSMAARAAWFGATLNRGQTCISSRRALVHRSQYEAFLTVLKPLVEAAPAMPLALSAQVEQAERLVQQAVEQGGRTLVNESDAHPSGSCRPQVVVDANPAMAICRDATFAPVLAVMPFDTLEEALALEAECPYALGAAIFTQQKDQAERLAAELRPGAVVVNDAVVGTAHPATPFGGRGQSGWGSTQGVEGLLDLTIPQVVSIKSGRFRPHYGAVDGKPMPAELFRGMLAWSHGRSFGERWRGFWQMIRGARQAK